VIDADHFGGGAPQCRDEIGRKVALGIAADAVGSEANGRLRA
jgi:hypothetical protein